MSFIHILYQITNDCYQTKHQTPCTVLVKETRFSSPTLDQGVPSLLFLKRRKHGWRLQRPLSVVFDAVTAVIPYYLLGGRYRRWKERVVTM